MAEVAEHVIEGAVLEDERNDVVDEPFARSISAVAAAILDPSRWADGRARGQRRAPPPRDEPLQASRNARSRIAWLPKVPGSCE